MKKVVFVFVLLFLLGHTSSLFAQFQPVEISDIPAFIGQKLRVHTVSGASFQGELYGADDEFLMLIDLDGQVITLLTAAVDAAWYIDPSLDKRSYYQDSASNRLILMPTGFPMETGEFHIADQEVAAVTMSYGVNPHFSLWGGISIPGALVSARFITPIGEKVSVSAGAFSGLSWIDFLGLLLPYALFSYGTPENNFTAGAGAVFSFDADVFEFNAAVLALGAKKVMSDTTAIVTETWIIWGEMAEFVSSGDEDPGLYSWSPVPMAVVPGIVFRIAGKRLSWDIGAVLPLTIQRTDSFYQMRGLAGETALIPLPLLSITYRID